MSDRSDPGLSRQAPSWARRVDARGRGWVRSDVIALRTRPCPDCDGRQRVLVWYDLGADRPCLECEDCQHSWASPHDIGSGSYCRLVGPFRDATERDLRDAGWVPNDFYVAACWWTEA